jgi:hypothetical protein
MIEITNAQGSIITFDGRVIEVFQGRESQRFHGTQIKKIEMIERKNGIEISGRTANTPFIFMSIDPGQKAVVDEFIAQVRTLMS